MHYIALKARGGQLDLIVPNELTSTFRSLFKTAARDWHGHCFVCKDTPANRKKWDQFLAATEQARAALETAQQMDASAIELEALVHEAQADTQRLEKRAEAAQARCTWLAAQQTKLNLAMSVAKTMHREAEQAIAALQPMHDEAASALEALIASTIGTLMRQRFQEVLLEQLRPGVVATARPSAPAIEPSVSA